ncbi:unnamed protein product [Protopolystoma xenopodis]|uniref:Uncharacterized protein n=1 Tax=Protopolystoma xenopodis TaxID=117903 RepID=A0A448X581_9PLAT|nr:unnamed protein product [Protopolystoma xenopodis]
MATGSCKSSPSEKEEEEEEEEKEEERCAKLQGETHPTEKAGGRDMDTVLEETPEPRGVHNSHNLSWQKGLRLCPACRNALLHIRNEGYPSPEASEAPQCHFSRQSFDTEK